MKKHIEEIAEIHNGYDFRRKTQNEENGDLNVVIRESIDKNKKLNTAQTVKMVGLNINDEKLLKNGDVLFIAKGVDRIAVAVRGMQEKTIATSLFFVIRIKNQNELLPEYVAWYINQKTAQKRLNESLAGTTIPNIQKKTLAELEIPIIPIKKQQKICKISELMQQEQILTKDLLEKKELLITQKLFQEMEA